MRLKVDMVLSFILLFFYLEESEPIKIHGFHPFSKVNSECMPSWDPAGTGSRRSLEMGQVLLVCCKEDTYVSVLLRI